MPNHSSTSLELMTIGFVILNVVTFYFWLDKPLDVEWPYRTTTERATSATSLNPERIPPNRFNYPPRKLANMGFGIQQPLDGLYQVSTFYSGPPSYRRTVRAACGAAVLAAVFGGIQCIAWSYRRENPVAFIICRRNRHATVSWVISCFLFMQDDENSRLKTYVEARVGSPKWWVSWMVYFAYDAYLYLFFRFVLLVLPFVLLRSVVSEAY